MSAENNWQFELEEYIRQGEPGQIEKIEAWQTAIGLQAVDGLKTSAYLLDTAKEHIEGKISIEEAQERIQSYYEQRTDRTEMEHDTREADMVSARIAKLLGEKAFQFSPVEWLTIQHVDYVPEKNGHQMQCAAKDNSKGKICTLNCPLDEVAVLQLIMENPHITQKEIALKIEKSERTVKNKIASLKEKGYIRRLNGKRNGRWQIQI